MSKKLFVIGLNYFGTEYELQGCINDVQAIQAAYVRHGFSDVTRYVETKTHDSATEPKKAQTLEALSRWIKAAKPGDFLAFHYSGHGTHTKDTSGDEVDREDEAICLLDDNVLDDELKQILVDQLPQGVKLRCFFDCCHSGTIMDLPWNAKFTGKLTKFQSENKDHRIHDIVMISGCRDDQTSADAWIEENKKNEGAMTWAWLRTLTVAETTQPDMTWYDVVQRMRFTLLDGGYEQIPQISLGDKKLIDTQVDFTQS